MEDHLKKPLRTTGVKHNILMDVDKPLQTVERVLPSNDQIEDAHVHEPRVKKQQKKVKRLAIAEDNVDGDDAKLFRKNIRAYNSIFAFTSFGVKLDKELASSRKGVYSFKAEGQIYHDLPSLIPNNDRPRYFQLYFYDTDHELANRMTVLQDANLSEEVMTKLRNIMEGNPYAEFFSRLKEHTNIQNLQVRIAANASLDQRVYNKPSVDQVAAIWVDGNNPNTPFERDIAEKQVGTKEYKNVANRSTTAKHLQIQVSNRQDYHPQLLWGCWPMKHKQFVVDIYIKIETTRLEYYRFEQSNYRREILEGIVDSVSAGEYRGDKVGQRVFLSGSFIGGPRDMRRRYMDAMALVQEFGRPDVFITMTCNPDWVEIQEQLRLGQRPQDRPDLRIFIFVEIGEENLAKPFLSMVGLEESKDFVCETFKVAAKERGLFESDNSISECLREAVTFKMPTALRSLFATILVHCNPTDVRSLCYTYYGDMSEDFQRSHCTTTEA
ncbi:uncharacterized protein LOC125825469 [Solanum verrucosum]|uniref:uncharacterized protein LOC125825469 n=1 Tax=Solanum verrucosum TaxID=315347 RepID=UPI0020D0B443|nr:uncharacterized protein LOC125825469 [Solanum verrucosum]